MPQYYNTSVRNLIYRLRKFKDILSEELTDEILNNEDLIKEMVQNQLYSGIDGYTASIQPPYALSTIKRKLKKGQPVDRVTLRDTGEFYQSLHVSFDDEGFFIASSDQELSNILKSRYGSPILRLSDENLRELIYKHIRPSLTEKMKKHLQNG